MTPQRTGKAHRISYQLSNDNDRNRMVTIPLSKSTGSIEFETAEHY